MVSVEDPITVSLLYFIIFYFVSLLHIFIDCHLIN